MKKLPSVEKVLEEECVSRTVNAFSHAGIARLVREAIDRRREDILGGADAGSAGEMLSTISREVAEKAARIGGLAMKPVINATGVVLHTNLGRAPMGRGMLETLERAAGYTDLEVDTDTGERTHRERRAVELLTLLTGAESAFVVNNTAAAVLLAVDTFARDGAVAVSRGELVEIGGSFRLPEILAGAARRVIEVGTTNRTNIADYGRAVDEGATLLLKVHASNYRIVGYTDAVPLGRLVELGRERGVPVMYDQGSGVLFPLQDAGIGGEEDVRSLLSTGVDIMAFSADKVLGGPQGGIILGSKEYVSRMKKNHLARALRVDKLTLACLETTLCRYWNGEAEKIPALGMILAGSEDIRARAESFAGRLSARTGPGASVVTVEDESSIGGGSFPLDPLPSWITGVRPPEGTSAAALASRLRSCEPSIFVRVKEDMIFVDLRTVGEDEEDRLIESIAEGMGISQDRE